MKQAFKRIGHNYFPSVGGRGTIILLHNSFITVLHLKQHCKGAAQAKELSFTTYKKGVKRFLPQMVAFTEARPKHIDMMRMCC